MDVRNRNSIKKMKCTSELLVQKLDNCDSCLTPALIESLKDLLYEINQDYRTIIQLKNELETAPQTSKQEAAKRSWALHYLSKFSHKYSELVNVEIRWFVDSFQNNVTMTQSKKTNEYLATFLLKSLEAVLTSEYSTMQILAIDKNLSKILPNIEECFRSKDCMKEFVKIAKTEREGLENIK